MIDRICRRKINWIFAAAILLTNSSCTNQQNKSKITIFAAASLAKVVPQAFSCLQDAFPDCRFVFNFASSSFLARQIIAGAQPDLFLSANQKWTDVLKHEKIIAPDALHAFLKNKLVIILPRQSKVKCTNLHDLQNDAFQRIAVGDPTNVPVGEYAKIALQNAGLWKQIEPKIIPAMDARAALAFVETGEVDAGIVYLTDARSSEKVKLAFSLPDSIQPEIHYQFALINKTPRTERLLQLFFKAAKIDSLFLKAGFTLPVNADAGDVL